MRGWLFALVLTACLAPRRAPGNTTAAIFRAEHARGAAVVLDMKSGDVVLSIGGGVAASIAAKIARSRM